MDITVAEGFSVGFINKEDNFIVPNTLTGCSVCAEEHETEKCSIFDDLIHINDSKVLPRAFLTLPADLKVETLSDGSKTVLATKTFSKGIQFGPYQAEKFYSLNPFDNFPIKIFGDSENILPDCYLDSRNEEKCNWMCYILPANNFEEQNLICYQLKLNIFYSVIRDIKPGEQLKVWYSTYYAAKMGSKTHIPKENEEVEPDEHEKIQKVAEKLPAKKLGAVERQTWCCKMCGHTETNVVKFAKHLQKHYLKMIKNLFVCNVCNGGFSTEKGLKLHRKYAHIIFTDHKPCDMENFIAKPEPSKPDLLEPCLPAPIDNLMSVTLTESDQLLMLDQLGIPNTGIYNDLNDAETLRAILLDDNTKASKTAQEKSIADFSLEFVESNDIMPKLHAPYYCDICNKLFNNLQYLYRHLKKHTGEYTCVQCLIVFTRRENYLRHPCFTANTLMKYNCSYCSKSFYQKKYLRRHITKHLEKYPCKNCGKNYKSKYDQENHKCSPIVHTEKVLYPCSHCNHKFRLEVYLQRHIKRCHLEKIKDQAGQPVICEICAKTYQTAQALRIHKKQHAEPKYECKICDKKFYRFDLYNNHLLRHGTENEVCDVCNKKFKTKISLKEHQKLHSNIAFSCELCGKKYTRKRGLKEHHQRIHSVDPVDCSECGETFKNNILLIDHKKTKHTQISFNCTVCNKTFSLHRLLTRHNKLYHSDAVFSCQYCSKSFKMIGSLRQHLKKSHLEYKDQWNKSETIVNFNKNIIMKNAKPANTTSNSKEHTEVLLSIPETNQDARKSVYFLENGTMETSTVNTTDIEDKEILLSVHETNQNSKEISINLGNTNLSVPKETTKLGKNISIAELLLPTADISTNDGSKSDETNKVAIVEQQTNTSTPIQDVSENGDLSVAETEQQITLGKNAYILEDGTIVQPQEQGNLMIYILNQ